MTKQECQRAETMTMIDKPMRFQAKEHGEICLMGIAEDPVLLAVARQLERRGENFFIFDQNRYPGDCHVNYSMSSMGLSGYLSIDGMRHEIQNIKSAYMRFLGAPPALAGNEEQERQEGERFLALDHLTRVWDAPTIGMLKPCATNFSKPLQISLFGSAQIRVPETLLTSNPQAALKFANRANPVSFKSTSSERSICMKLEGRWLRRLPKIKNLPVQFQKYIEGLDIRVHVAGNFIHALAIETGASDYRYSERYFGIEARTWQYELPEPIKKELVRITQSLGLVVSGIDLRKTADGRFFCFEVNPTPGFSYFDPEPAFPIANAICDLLTGETYVQD